MKAKLFSAFFGGLLALSIIGTALADAQPPTNGGNGAGQSGQCTGNIADRPASCQATKK